MLENPPNREARRTPEEETAGDQSIFDTLAAEQRPVFKISIVQCQNDSLSEESAELSKDDTCDCINDVERIVNDHFLRDCQLLDCESANHNCPQLPQAHECGQASN